METTPQPSDSALAGSSSATMATPRQTAEDARKDRTLAEFMLMLDDYEPLVHSLLASKLHLSLSPISDT
jgi:hypothetical protein